MGRGTQFKTDKQPENEKDGFFTVLKHPDRGREPYTEMETYKDKPRVKAFQSGDASRRGEFTATIRTEQYRETLRKEQKLIDKYRDIEAEEKAMAKYQEELARRPKTYLYDVGRTKVTEFDPKSH